MMLIIFNEAALYRQIKLFTVNYKITNPERNLPNYPRTRRSRAQYSHRSKDESWLSGKWAVSITATTGAQPEHVGGPAIGRGRVRC